MPDLKSHYTAEALGGLRHAPTSWTHQPAVLPVTAASVPHASPFQQCWVTLVSDVDLYFVLSFDGAQVVDETATAGNTRCFLLPAKTPQDWWFDKETTIAIKGAAVGRLRIVRSSR